MSFEVETTYENGVLKLDEPLPFKDQERVVVTVEVKKPNATGLTCGLIGYGNRDPEVVRRIAEDDDELFTCESPRTTSR